MTDYSSRMRADIKRLINDFGTTVTFRREAVSTYDPTTSELTKATADDETVKVAFTDFNITEVDGDSIRLGDRRAYMSAYDTDGTLLTKEPRPDDFFIGQDSPVRILNARRILSNGNLIGYVCQVRE